MNGRILTCVYCGHEYPQNTPSAGSEVLTEHIKVCPRHPMRKAEADIALLRSALVGLIGADTEQELREMEAMMRLLPAPDADKAVSINAIHALLATAIEAYKSLGDWKYADREAAWKWMFEQGRKAAEADTERLEWLMRNVSGAEFRRLGVTYGGNCGRDRIDAAMKTPNAQVTGAAPTNGERSNDV